MTSNEKSVHHSIKKQNNDITSSGLRRRKTNGSSPVLNSSRMTTTEIFNNGESYHNEASKSQSFNTEVRLEIKIDISKHLEVLVDKEGTHIFHHVSCVYLKITFNY